MTAIQSRFEVAVPELPDSIDPASYSTSPNRDLVTLTHRFTSDFVKNTLTYRSLFALL